MSKSGEMRRSYAFGPFLLDAEGRVLLRDGEVIQLQPKAVEILINLVKRHGLTVSKDELIKAVWPDTFVEEGNLTLNISALRKALGDNPTSPTYIETVPRRGYRFKAVVSDLSAESGNADRGNAVAASTAIHARRWAWIAVAACVALLVAALAVLYWRTGRKITLARSEIHSAADEAEVKRVVRESQVFETLTLYTKPESFEPGQLEKYWLPEDLGGQEISRVEAAVQRLRQKDQRYGLESRLERFDFTYVRIFAPGEYAEAGTMERWYVPLYENGKPVLNRNVYLGPYTVDYTLRKVKGVWLIEKNTTPRPHQNNN
jgi:DNA-binding winged helix-turn-helix (wHTH) protein